MKKKASLHLLTIKPQYLRTDQFVLKMQQTGSSVSVDVSPLAKCASGLLVNTVIEPGGRITIRRYLDGVRVSVHELDMPRVGESANA